MNLRVLMILIISIVATFLLTAIVFFVLYQAELSRLNPTLTPGP